MANPQIICDGNSGRAVAFNLAADDSGTPPQAWPAHGTVAISDYTKAFVVSLGSGAFQVKAKITKNPGDPTDTVSATATMVDSASGAALPPLVLDVDLVAPPPPAQKATHLVVSAGPTVVTGSGATDPGSGTVTAAI